MINLEILKNCRICPRKCGVDRYKTRGYCKSGADLKINIWQKHYGEEPFISGYNGSGTIFFSGCNLRCCFCQNYQISQLNHGSNYTISELADIMLSLQADNAHNINLVSPTQFTPQIVTALKKAKEKGLIIPVVWNTNSYENLESIKILEDSVDIYLADFKYASEAAALKYSDAKDYFKIAASAVKEMFHKKGNIKLNDKGIAVSGLAVRILVLPHNLIGLENILLWLAENIGNELYLSLMSQYYPAWKANDYPEISRSLYSMEYQQAIELAEKFNFKNCLIQELNPSPEWTPDFV